MDLGVAEFLNALCAELVAEGTSSRDLVAIEFDPDSDNVDVLTGMEPHLRSYPDLISILKAIGQTCSQDRIDAQQLRRISFLKEEIKLELVSRYGHQRIIYSYPIEERRLLKGFSTEWLSGAGLRAHIFGIRAVMSILGGLAALVR